MASTRATWLGPWPLDSLTGLPRRALPLARDEEREATLLLAAPPEGLDRLAAAEAPAAPASWPVTSPATRFLCALGQKKLIF